MRCPAANTPGRVLPTGTRLLPQEVHQARTRESRRGTCAIGRAACLDGLRQHASPRGMQHTACAGRVCLRRPRARLGISQDRVGGTASPGGEGQWISARLKGGRAAFGEANGMWAENGKPLAVSAEMALLMMAFARAGQPARGTGPGPDTRHRALGVLRLPRAGLGPGKCGTTS
jgi:hypothetical protein